MDQKYREFKILLVDDREENIIALEEMLETENRLFVRATSGNDALKQVLKNEDIGLIMVDVQMPDMDGFEVVRYLKSNSKTRDISVIFVTAINKDERYILKGFDEGAVDYLQKPLDIAVTRAKVNVFERLYFYQHQLKNTLKDVEKINKQLEQFVYTVAHDLKSPLSGIIGMVSIMNEEPEIANSPQLKEYTELISSAASHLSGMITSILDYSRKSMDQQSVEQVDVDEMVKQIAHLLFPPSNIRIEVLQKLPVIKTRKLKLQQVFQNLIGNAIKYNDKQQGHIEIDYEDNGDHYEFAVKDNGPGIAAKDEERIFKLFQTTGNRSNNESSTGVGLNVVKMLIEEQGGSIRVKSNPGEGSCFYFIWKK